MGMGSVMGNAVAGWEASAASRQNETKLRLAEEESAQRGEYRAKQMEAMDMNMAANKQATAAANTPEAKQLRALEMEAATEKAKMTIGVLKGVSGTPEGQVAELQQEVAQMKQQTEDKAAVDTTVNLNKDINTILGDDGSLSDTEIDRINETISSESAFQKSFPNPVTMYNPNNTKHKAGLKDTAKKMLMLQGIDITKMPEDKATELIENFEGSLEEYGKRGIMLTDSVTGEMKPVQGLFDMTNTNSAVPSTTKAKVAKNMEAIASNVTDRNADRRDIGLNKTPEWATGDGKTKNKGKMLYQGQNPSDVKQKYDIIGMAIPQDLQDAVDYNSNLVNPKGKKGESNTAASWWAGATPEQVQEALPNQLASLSSLGIDDPERKELMARAKSGIELLKDESDRKTMRASLKQLDTMAAINTVFDKKEPATPSETQKLATIQMTNTDNNNNLVKERDRINGDLKTVEAVNKTLATLNEYQEDLLSGRFAPEIVSEASRNLGFIETVSRKFGGKEIPKSTLLASIEANTRIGKLVVDFVKATSGQTVTTDEYARLRMIIAGAEGGDPQAMATAMQTFRDTHIESLVGDRDTLHIKYKLPYTAYSLKGIEDRQTDYKSMITSEGTTVSLRGDKQSAQKEPVKTDVYGNTYTSTPPKGF